MRVLGVDPGLSRCGIGVVDGPTSRPTAVRAGVVRTPAGAPTGRRLALLYDELCTVVAASRPDALALEWVFFNANVRTAMGVGQAAGVALLCAERAGVAVAHYTPTQVKATVTGDGTADKAQVGYMVRVLLGLASVPEPADAADALALALCHLQHAASAAGGAMSPRLAAALARATPGAQRLRPGGRRSAQPAQPPQQDAGP
ncbi:MAG TPA: crossover junction endodeoxyribonuclease RuvC [Egibacteraceae bacterium]|nr:crossover junction endodeoxyribonuclease RuvC [Egibacteraceae bacterium]